MTQTQQQSNSEPEIDVVDEQPQEEISSDSTEVESEPEQQEEQQEAEKEFDPKQRVEFSTPEQQKKFNDIYKQAKMSDARNKMQSDMLAKAMEKISELESRFAQTDYAEAERILTARLKEAREIGDEEKADKILNEIIEFKVESKLKAQKPIVPQQQIDIADPDVQTIVQYANETDSSGNPVRPWINADHPAHNNAMKMAGAIAMQVNADLGYVDVPEVMKRMDEAMRPKPTAQKQPVNSRAPDPMRSNLTNPKQQVKMKLSPQELAAAKKLGVKPEEYLKWK